ncbi:MAG: hypothetical protein JO291_14525, partial [Acidimicrobiia bacterium]|nr:hypothetical protein [Acidimicrobiia bacterium]
GDAATKAKAAAVAAVSGGTAGAVTTNVSGDGYEVTVTKTDGSQVEVRLDSSFTAVEDGHEGHDGDGGHGRGCDHDGGDHDGDAPAAPSTSTSSSSSSSSSST